MKSHTGYSFVDNFIVFVLQVLEFLLLVFNLG